MIDEWEIEKTQYFLKIYSDQGNLVETLEPDDFRNVASSPEQIFSEMVATIRDQIFKISETVDDVLDNL